jgi:hypothetical protein
MVTHQEQLAIGDRPRRLVAGHGGRLRLARLGVGEDVWFVEDLVVDVDEAVVADVDGVATLADDTLDERRAAFAPLLGRGEHDDVAALVRVEAWRELVDQDVLLRFQGPLHRLLLDLVWLCHEALDDEEDDEREDEGLDDLEETPEDGSLGHKSGSIGARAGTRP